MPSSLRSRRPLRAALATLALMAAGAAPVASAHAAATAAYMPHEVIVGYAARVPHAVTAAEVHAGLHPATPRPPTAPPVSRAVRLPRGESVGAALARLRHRPGVVYALPDYLAHAAGSFYPNDRGRSHRARGWERIQWNLLAASGVDAPWAWSNLRADRRPGGRGVVVAIIDSGVAYRNYMQFHKSPDFNRTKFVSPYDFIAKSRYPLDREGHGTFVAGVVGESTNNRLGLTGLAYGASIMPLRVLNANGIGDEVAIASAIRYAVRHHAKVINLSLEFLPNQVTSSSQIPQIASAIEYAIRRGVVVVAAAGNDETQEVAYPAREPGVISVGATTRDRCLADYSNGGPGLDLVAPGGGDDAILDDPDCHPARDLPSIYQLTLSDPPHWARFGYPNYYIGTSMASPEVAATAAMVIASGVIGRHPTPAQVLARLEQTATPLGTLHPNSSYGFGLINAGAATARPGQTP